MTNEEFTDDREEMSDCNDDYASQTMCAAVRYSDDVLRLMEAILKLEPEVKHLVDPQRQSDYMKGISGRISEAFKAVAERDSGITKERLLAFTDDDWKKEMEFSSGMERQLANIKEALHVLKGCHETMGIDASELERLARRYEVESNPLTLLLWHDVEQIEQRALLARIQSDKAGSKNRRVNDEQILMVLRNAPSKTRAQQAAMCNMGERNFVRRVKKLKEQGRFQE